MSNGFDLDKIILEAAKSKLTASDVYPKETLDEFINKARVDLNAEYKKAKFIVKLAEEYGNTEVLSLGNISGTIGAAKSKKTYANTMLISAFCGCTDFGFITDLDNRGIVFIDTEQAIYHVQKIGKRVKKLINANPEKLDILALRQYPETELRVALVERYLEKHAGEYSMVFIDGIVDLVADYNDQKESRQMISKLLSWSAKYDCHINSVLHLNKDKVNARGHLGAELINKSETIIRVDKEDDTTSVIRCDEARNKAFKEFRFFIDEDGLPKRNDLPTGYFHKGVPLPELEPIIDNSAGLTYSDDLPF